MREEEKKMYSLRIVGGKDGPENGSARFEGFYRRIGKSPMMGRGGTVSGDHFWIAIRELLSGRSKQNAGFLLTRYEILTC